jgi:hypothetical protein
MLFTRIVNGHILTSFTPCHEIVQGKSEKLKFREIRNNYFFATLINDLSLYN